MLRSLVGSEMCIRDSQRRVRGWRGAVNGDPASMIPATTTQEQADDELVTSLLSNELLPQSSWLVGAMELGEMDQGIGEEEQEAGCLPHERELVAWKGGVPRLLPQANVFDEMPDMPATDFMSHTSQMKKIFKLQQSGANVEMMVHRVGNTIVLDGVLDHFMDSWAVQGDEWTMVDGARVERVPSESPSPPCSGEEHMGNQFLFFKDNEQTTLCKEHPDQDTGLHGWVRDGEQCGAESSSAVGQGRFRRVFNWQFRDLDMILASNHMIWSSEESSSLSLRLHHAEQELGALSCLDYWLENTMSCIDNMGLCYHVDGCMQGYEIVGTEDLADGAQRGRRLQFSPDAVLDQAYSTLQFLRSHCCRDGGTYLLSRNEDSNQLELYEVTQFLKRAGQADQPDSGKNLGQGLGEDAKTEFGAIPRSLARKVALLCGRMAKNIGSNQKEDMSEADRSRARRLFHRCASLLDPLQDWVLWAGSIEAAGDSYLDDTENMGGHLNGAIFPRGLPNNLTVHLTANDMATAQGNKAHVLVHHQATMCASAQESGSRFKVLNTELLNHYLKAAELYELVVRQSCRSGHESGIGIDQHHIRSRICSKSARASAAVASLVLQCEQETPSLQVGLEAVRVSMGCVPEGWDSMMGALLILAGWCFGSAARLGVPHLLMPIPSVSSTGSLPYEHPRHAPMLAPLTEASIEETLNRASMCFLQGLKLLSHADAQWCAAVHGLGSSYSWLGHHYLQTGRFTKAHRHFLQGIELFRSLAGPVSTSLSNLEQIRVEIGVQLSCMRSGLAKTLMHQAMMLTSNDKPTALSLLDRSIAALAQARLDRHGSTEEDPGWREVHLSLIHISEPTRLLSISYAVFCLKKKKKKKENENKYRKKKIKIKKK
eukprot:TRINITY_DN12494_c0_g1_i6.p1 TRINITY_DN12494_c0_g1~~TRINITY_DN12494_c0_g1_i6.p1  ORF type:complete len:924 (-),score=217.68 TRINITY_DN12494_c0_g1_i6:31-2679(-)